LRQLGSLSGWSFVVARLLEEQILNMRVPQGRKAGSRLRHDDLLRQPILLHVDLLRRIFLYMMIFSTDFLFMMIFSADMWSFIISLALVFMRTICWGRLRLVVAPEQVLLQLSGTRVDPAHEFA
jgi:hypothetical protein